MKVFINEMENVMSVEIISGHPFLRSSALQAARESEFSTQKVNGKAVLVTGIIVFNFVPE